MASTDLKSTLDVLSGSSSKSSAEGTDFGTAVQPSASTATGVRKYQKDLYGSSFLWPLMLLANNIGEILGVIKIPGDVAYWIGLGVFLIIGLPGVIGKPVIQFCRKPKTVTEGKESKLSRSSRLIKYTFWRAVVRDVLSFVAGALYVAGDNLTLLYTPEILMNPEQLTLRSYFRSYLIAGALLMILLAHGLFIVLDPMCGLETDKKTTNELKTRTKNRAVGTFQETIALSTLFTSQDVTVASDNVIDGRDCSEAERAVSPSRSDGDEDEDSDDTSLDSKYWQVYVQRLTIFIALAALADQFYGAIIDEITQSNMNFTTGVACVDINRTAGSVFYVALSAFYVLGVLTVSLVYAYKERKTIRERACKKGCGVLELLICIVLTFLSLVYVPVYLTGDNQWPWICYANENDELDFFEGVRQFFLWLSFFITFILLFMEPVLVTWPRKLLSKLHPNDDEQEWYMGYRHINEAIPIIAKDVKEMCSRSKPNSDNTARD